MRAQKQILIGLLAFATTASFAAPAVLRKSGDCTIQEKSPTAFSLANQDLNVTGEVRVDPDFFGEYIVLANPALDNKSGRKLEISYNVAFFDKAGALIGCAGQSGDLDANAKGMQFASCIVHVPREQAAKIASYQIVLYEDAAKPKK